MRLNNVDIVAILSLCMFAATGAQTIDTSPKPATTALIRRGGCSGGVAVCCGSSSVGCSGGVCKACCGSDCGCFYERGGSCNSETTPCVNPDDPDFPTTNGECVEPSKPPQGGGGSAGKCRKLYRAYEKCLRNN